MTKIPKYTHVIWDWNGTLLDDVPWCIDCINLMLRGRNLPVFDSVESYHRVFGFPIRDYYQRAGFDFDKDPFENLAKEYIQLYHSSESKVNLFTEAKEIISELNSKEINQIILSASEIGNLLRQVKPYGINSYFDEILGVSDVYATSKVAIAKDYMRRVRPDKAVLIGDTIHDKEVADVLGIDIILIASGHQSKTSLVSSGALVIDRIEEVRDFF